MRAPSGRRSRDKEIVDEALEVIKPPADKRDAMRTEVVDRINSLQYDVQNLSLRGSHGEFTRKLATYLKNLRATKRTYVSYPRWPDTEHEKFLAQLAAEIERVNRYHEVFSSSMRHASRPRDTIAETAVFHAWRLLPSRRRTLTTSGPLHRISALFYEAATGKPNCRHLLKYMREFKNKDTKNVLVQMGLEHLLTEDPAV
jgi:hypothetical protein